VSKRDSLQAELDNQILRPSQMLRTKLAKVSNEILNLQQKLSGPEAALQQHSSKLLQLNQQWSELQGSAASATQQMAEHHLEAVSTVLSQIAATASELVQCVAALFGADSTPAAVAIGQHGSSVQGEGAHIQRQLIVHMSLAEAVSTASGSSLHRFDEQRGTAQPLAICRRMLEDCRHLQDLADEFVPGATLAEGISWLSDAMKTAVTSISCCLQAVPAQQAFSNSPSSSALRQHLPALQLLGRTLQQNLQELITASLRRGVTLQQVQSAAAAVLRLCKVCPKGHLPEPGSLQYFLQALDTPELEPAAAAVTSLLRLSVVVVLACCKLTRSQQSSGVLDEMARQATGTARQLGMEPALADMPSDAAGLGAYIKQQQRLLQYAAEQLQAHWLLLQCSQGYVGGPLALLQESNLQLQASTRAFLPASYLSARFADVLEAMHVSLFDAGDLMQAAGSVIADSGEPHTAVLLQQSWAAQCLTGSDVSALLLLLQSFMQLAGLNITASAETALVDGDASLLLDTFKAATLQAVGLLKQGRDGLQSCCSRLSERSEFLQKEVLKSEISLIQSAYKQQLSISQEQHLQELQDTPPGELWVQVSSGWGRGGLPDVAGWQPAWDKVQLVDVAQLPALLRILAAGAPAEAAGQLVPGSVLVLAWFSQHQAIEACLRHGLEAQGELLRSVYDFCPQVRARLFLISALQYC
jgi:hypothetical protein